MALVSVALASCGFFRRGDGLCNEDAAYLQAESRPPLKIPPGLEAPDTQDALRVPELNTPEPPPRKRSEGCLDEPPPYATPRESEPQA